MSERNLIEWSKYAIDDPKNCALEAYGRVNLIKNIIHIISSNNTIKAALYFAECVIELTEE